VDRGAAQSRRTRVERGICRQPNGKLAVCARRAGRLHFRTAGDDLDAARRACAELIAALEAGHVPASPHLRLDTVASLWSERFEAMVAAGDRRPLGARADRAGWRGSTSAALTDLILRAR
jgi:hypothetical protein